MKIIQNILTDKGSKYSVSGGLVYSKLEAQNFIKNLKRFDALKYDLICPLVMYKVQIGQINTIRGK